MNTIDKETIVTTMSEINVIKSKVHGWWYDTFATIHVSYDKPFFKNFHKSNGEKEIIG